MIPLPIRTPEDPDDLFARARAGDQAAWRDLYAACQPKVLRVVRRRLTSRAIRSLYDSSDFVGDVWKSLAEKPDAFDFPTLDALTAFLAVAAERKVVDAYRRCHAQKNDIDRNFALGHAGGDGRDASGDVASGGPTPSQVAEGNEASDRLISSQPDEERRILEMKRDGYSNEDVARETGWSLRKVQRFLKGLSDSWVARYRDGGRP